VVGFEGARRRVPAAAKVREDTHRRVPDAAKVGELIGWAPERSLEEFIAGVAADLRAQHNSAPA
jgi:hypothetical protein